MSGIFWPAFKSIKGTVLPVGAGNTNPADNANPSTPTPPPFLHSELGCLLFVVYKRYFVAAFGIDPYKGSAKIARIFEGST